MNCKICSALFQDFLDKCLCEELMAELDEHMKTCSRCRVSLRTYRLTIVLSQKADPPCCVSDDKVDQLKKVLLRRFFTKGDA